MADAHDSQSLVDAAEQAASAGDYPTAERLLRDALAVQEGALGLQHPDLANTLNNLGVLCERGDKPAEAEDCYRRAYAIATAALAPDHPFVTTSRKNLEDFCAARGRPLHLAAPGAAPPQRVATPPPEVPPQRPQPPRRERVHMTASPEPPRRSLRPLVAGSLILGALVLLALLLRPWFRGSDEGTARADGALPAAAGQAEPPLEGPAPAAAPAPAPDAAPPERQGLPSARTSPEASREGDTPSPGEGSGTVEVMEARLCRTFSTRSADWQCDPANSPAAPGPFTFFTRVKAGADTTVEHRWYRGNLLHQTVTLRVRANPASGFRTYSRNTVSPERTGDWRVEIRSREGAVLHEERLVVR